MNTALIDEIKSLHGAVNDATEPYKSKYKARDLLVRVFQVEI